MKKKLTIKINSTYKYLQVWNGIFNLTNKELEVLSTFIDIQDISIKKFKDKGVLRVKDNNYTLNNLLDPNTNTVEINLIKK